MGRCADHLAAIAAIAGRRAISWRCIQQTPWCEKVGVQLSGAPARFWWSQDLASAHGALEYLERYSRPRRRFRKGPGCGLRVKPRVTGSRGEAALWEGRAQHSSSGSGVITEEETAGREQTQNARRRWAAAPTISPKVKRGSAKSQKGVSQKSTWPPRQIAPTATKPKNHTPWAVGGPEYGF